MKTDQERFEDLHREQLRIMRENILNPQSITFGEKLLQKVGLWKWWVAWKELN